MQCTATLVGVLRHSLPCQSAVICELDSVLSDIGRSFCPSNCVNEPEHQVVAG